MHRRSPPKSAEELELDAARGEFEQIRVIGIAFRGDRGQAYLAKGEERWLVVAGATVANRFRVETIRADAVEVKDPVTQVGGAIPLSGN